MRALGISPRDYRDMGTVVDLGPCNPCNSISWKPLPRVFQKVSFCTKLHIIIYPLRPGSRLLDGIFEKNSIRNRGPIGLKSFLRSFTDFGGRTGWHHWIPLKAILDMSQVARHEDLKQFIWRSQVLGETGQT